MTVSVAIISTSRADFGHVVWPLKHMQENTLITPTFIVLGSHLSPEFGHTVTDVIKHGVDVDHRIESLISSDSDIGMAKTIGVSILGLADLLGSLRPDLLLVTADRYEMLSAAAVALALRIPIAHVEGGEISSGAIDDAVRNALTKMSHLHFVPHRYAARRVLAMGEEPWRICISGAPSLDHLSHRQLMPKDELEQHLRLTLSEDFLVVSFHPVTLDSDTVGEAEALYAALAKIERQIVFCFPNCDAGSRQLIERATAFCHSRHSAMIFTNLDHWVYWNMLHFAKVIVGNSSSALMEAPSIPLPAVNIGRRQSGRLMARSVIDCRATPDEILNAYQTASSDAFRQEISTLKNPYGDGHAASRMCEFILQHTDHSKLINKAARPVKEFEGNVGFEME